MKSANKEPPGWHDKDRHFLHQFGDQLLVGWQSIGAYFRLPGSEMRDRFGKELRAAGIVFDLYLRNGAPCAWESRLKLWAMEQHSKRGRVL